MNKIIQVNIGGLVFQIDESAYLRLDQYLAAIRSKYAGKGGEEDIVHDIEARIAELFTERLQGRHAVTLADVEHVIQTMGQPDDYDEEPTSQSYRDSQRKRFYRDTENRQLGGVCAGFGAYFDIDPLWIRLLFVIIFLFGGSGLLIYIVLWVIMPEAKTPSEKLEMRGEKINISNIEKTVRNSARDFQDKATAMGEEVKEVFSSDQMKKTSRSLGEGVERIVALVTPVVQAIFKIFVLAIVIACVAALIAMAFLLFSTNNVPGAQLHYVREHLIEGKQQGLWFFISVMALAAIPLFSLMVKGLKYILNVKLNFKAFDWSMLLLWLVCLSVVIAIAIRLADDFEAAGKTYQRIELNPTPGQPLQVHVTEQESEMEGFVYQAYDRKHIRFQMDSLEFDDIDLTVEMSPDTTYSITVIRSARGKSKQEAEHRADKLRYPVTLEGSFLNLPDNILLQEGDLWREQQIDLILRIPKDSNVVLEGDVEEILRHNDFTDGMDEDLLYNRKLVMTYEGLKPDYQ